MLSLGARRNNTNATSTARITAKIIRSSIVISALSEMKTDDAECPNVFCPKHFLDIEGEPQSRLTRVI